MAQPTNRTQFKNWCLRRLGQNVIEINVDDDQVEDRIDEAIDYWRTFHHDASERTYMKYQLTSTDLTNKYIPVNNDVIGVTRILPVRESSQTSGDALFNFEYQLRLSDFLNYRISGYSDVALTKAHLANIDDVFKHEGIIEFNKHTDKIVPQWDWSFFTAGDYIIIECIVALDMETYTDVWSDRMLQRYATALIKMQWGNNMKKFAETKLLGGQMLNGQQIYDEAIQEITELEQKIRDEMEEPPRFFVG